MPRPVFIGPSKKRKKIDPALLEEMEGPKMANVQEKAARTLVHAQLSKAGGWWGSKPTDGDTFMDYISAIQRADPRKAVKKMEEWLKAREFSGRYAAMGVWDVVVSSGIEPLATVFKAMLVDDIQKAAKRRFSVDDMTDWAGDDLVQKFLTSYKMGKPTGKLRYRFNPRTVEGIWYIDEVVADRYDPLSVAITIMIRNRYTDETKEANEEYGAPDMGGYVADMERVEAINHGGKNAKQQSVVLEVYNAIDNLIAEMQIDVDTKTGEVKWAADWEVHPEEDY